MNKFEKRDKILKWLFENFKVKPTTAGTYEGEITVNVFLDEIHIKTHEQT